MTSSPSEIDIAENSLREWLKIKPPPFYVERILVRGDGPSSETYFNKIVTRMNPTLSHIFTQFDLLRCSDRISIGYINDFVYRKYLGKLIDDQERLSRFLAEHESALSPLQHARVIELLGYMMAETSLVWATSVVPQLRLNPDAAEFKQALATCLRAETLAVDSSDYLSASRASYNVGRIYQEFDENIEDAIFALNRAFIWCETYAAHHDMREDYQWLDRRFEILHRLVELCANHPQAASTIEDYAHFLKSPSLGQLKPKAPTIEHFIKNGEDKQLLNFPFPISLQLDAIYQKLDNTTAILSYVHGQRNMVLMLVHKRKVFVKKLDPDSVHQDGWDGWDCFFRPTGFDFQSTIHIPSVEERPKTVAVNFGPFETHIDYSSGPTLKWRIERDIINVTPHAPDDWSSVCRKDAVTLDSSVRWQESLWKILIGPIKPQLDSLGVKHLVVSPDGGLNLVPFHLLLSQGGRFVSDDYLVSYVPNLPMLVSSLAGSPCTDDLPRILIVEDSTNLSWSRRECEFVASNFKQSHVQVLSGSSATHENLLAEVHRADIIHFCTHGRFDPMDLDHSGLLLANNSWLTLADIESLEVKTGTLVFLSACDTGRLKLTSRIDTLGICYAFLAAGAKTVIGTSWEVHDLSTALFVYRFYQEYIEHRQSRLTSLYNSARWLRELSVDDVHALVEEPQLFDDKEHPFDNYYYWGSFSLHGDWR